MTPIQTAVVQIKSYFIDLGIVLGLSFFTKFWYAITNEMSVVLVAHVVVLVLVAVFVRVIGRWIGEHIDSLSDVETMEVYECDRSVFDILKEPKVHGTLYSPNVSYVVYDVNKIRITSKFLFIRSVETFELIFKKDTVSLNYLAGKYESSSVYEWVENGIMVHWKTKPKGFYRAVSLLLGDRIFNQAKKDFRKFVEKNKDERHHPKTNVGW